MDGARKIDDTIAAWAEAHPGLDLDSMRTALLLAKAVATGRRVVDRALAECGVTAGEFDVLASLLLAEGRALKPGELAREGMLSPAGMTHRLDVLERRELVRRRPDPFDRRSVQVVLTAKGEEVARIAADAHVAAERRTLDALTARERAALDRLMRKLLSTPGLDDAATAL